MTGRSLRDIRPRRLRDRLRVSLPVFCALFFILSVLHAFAEDRTTRTLRRLQAIDCEAVRMAYADMAARWPDRFPADPEWLATLPERRDELLRAIMGDWGPFYGEPEPVEKAERLLAEIRGHLLANPLLDAGKILVVRREQKRLGLHQNWQQPRDLFAGQPNALGILQNIREKPTFQALDTTPENGYLGELCLHWDGKRVMYTRRTDRTDTPPKVRGNRAVEAIHRVFELDTSVAGAQPRELPLILDNDVNCYAGCYLPDGATLFLSDASMVGVPCVVGSSWVASLYRREPDGAIRRLTFDQDNNWCPTVMPDGRVLFLHWEYADITHYCTRILFTMNPDGTTQRAFYGSNSYWPNALFNARALPDAPNRFTAIVSGHHGQPRYGELVLFDANLGRKEAKGVIQRFPERGKPVLPIVRDRVADYSWPKFAFPWPLGNNYVLVSARPTPNDGWGLYLADTFNNLTPIIEDPTYVFFEAIPLQPAPVPPVIPSKIDPEQKDGLVKIIDIYEGPGLRGVPRGTVKALRLYTYSFAYRWMGAETDHHGLDGPWDIKRILGTVPVEADGSAFFKIPANIPFSIQPLDEKGRALQLMRSWLNVMPGEFASCTGCHEETESSSTAHSLLALQRPPSEIKPWYGPERGFSFRREIQPVLDRYCIRCHDRDDRPGQPNLTSRPDICIKTKETFYLRDGLFPPTYIALCSYVRNHTQEGDNDLLVPCDLSASTTALVQMLEAGHHGVKLDTESWDRINTWIDLNRMGHGTWSETVGATNVAPFAARRAELQRRYANLEEDHEKTFGVAQLSLPACAPEAEPPPPPPVRFSVPFYPPPERMCLPLGEGVEIELVKIPAGSYVNASGTNTTFIKKPFWIGVDEVTNEQYRRLVPEHDSKLERGEFMQFSEQERGYPLNRSRQPVCRVSQEEAEAFCRKLAGLTGKRVRLPSGDEWEWAGRAGERTPLWYGEIDTPFAPFANLADKTFRRQDRFRAQVPGMAVPPWRPADERVDDGFRVSAPVDRFKPNPWGLRNVHGNVWEWTADRVQPPPTAQPVTLPEPAPDTALYAVARGGSWWTRPKEATFAARVLYRPWQKVHDVGFRIVIED
ncbi:MAG: SUMF1/EgtB/PvdO family nonheme iron enzyme [Kiritimatiellae bacterium]|nr:SUMF1/EgtB/PvdO family nonheme iron enzyme [Kiritimatiellia bacterium]